MKEYLPEISRQEVSDGLLSTISANWDRIVDTVHELFQRLVENPQLINKFKEIFENLT